MKTAREKYQGAQGPASLRGVRTAVKVERADGLTVPGMDGHLATPYMGRPTSHKLSTSLMTVPCGCGRGVDDGYGDCVFCGHVLGIAA